MDSSGGSTLTVICVLGAIWTAGLWKSVQYALRDGRLGQGSDLGVSRRVIFHTAALVAAAGPVYTHHNGISRNASLIWAGGIAVLSAMMLYWYFLKRLLGVSVVEIVSESGSVRLPVRDADGFIAALMPR